MIGYVFTTELEAINARTLCATYKMLPNPQGDTLYWIDYNHSQLDGFYYITYVDELENVLGEPIEFELTLTDI